MGSGGFRNAACRVSVSRFRDQVPVHAGLGENHVGKIQGECFAVSRTRIGRVQDIRVCPFQRAGCGSRCSRCPAVNFHPRGDARQRGGFGCCTGGMIGGRVRDAHCRAGRHRIGIGDRRSVNQGLIRVENGNLLLDADHLIIHVRGVRLGETARLTAVQPDGKGCAHHQRQRQYQQQESGLLQFLHSDSPRFCLICPPYFMLRSVLFSFHSPGSPRFSAFLISQDHPAFRLFPPSARPFPACISSYVPAG